ncbi:protein saal1 [Leptopilina boulardi]|uniref:protein saal1 n=1 Tax=Leptopilina boulardi TaxID=63433 RepID=UPI0021F5B635|nr:protein saal1 [Leptopilina boulardi]XP_051172522.1 protein saal1 [Leptopilina boulardi]
MKKEKEEMDDDNNSNVDDDDNDFYEGSSVLESQQFNDIERNTMKGDTVGDTVYSSKWIINTLISLSKICEDGWSNELEESLCILWDMTGEKDIVKFLLENDFLKMSEFTLKVSEEPRLTEIILGILGNMCCDKQVLEALENNTELTSLIFNLLHSEDSETLVQLIRILQASAWCIQQNSNSIWLTKLKDCEFLGESLIFILNSSMKDNLLMAVLDFIATFALLESNALKDLFIIDHLTPALLESLTQIMQGSNESHSTLKLKSIDNWLSIITKITKMELLHFSDDENDENFRKLTEIMWKILRPFTQSFNLIPLDEQIFHCIQRTVDIVLICQKNEFHFGSEVILVILQIMSVLYSAMENFQSEIEKDPENALKVLLNYLVNYWIEILGILEIEELSTVLRLCDKETVNNLMKTTNVKTSKDKIHKLQEILSCLSL